MYFDPDLICLSSGELDFVFVILEDSLETQ